MRSRYWMANSSPAPLCEDLLAAISMTCRTGLRVVLALTLPPLIGSFVIAARCCD